MPYVITRDGKLIAPTRYADEFALLKRFHELTSQSMDWAIQYEGYAVVEVPDDRRAPIEAEYLRRMAEYKFTNHGHTDWAPLTRANCGACALGGYKADKQRGPNYAGWGRAYVQAGRPIPDKWLAAFQGDRTGKFDPDPDNPNQGYMDNLALDIATFGVRSENGGWLIEPKA